MRLSKRLLKAYQLEKYTKVNPQEMLIDDEPGEGTGLPYSRRRASSSDSPQIRSRRGGMSGGKRGRELIHRIAEGERLSSDDNRDLLDSIDASGAERAYTNNPDKFPDSFTRDNAKKYFPNAKIGRQGRAKTDPHASWYDENVSELQQRYNQERTDDDAEFPKWATRMHQRSQSGRQPGRKGMSREQSEAADIKASLNKAEVDPLKSGESFTTLNNYEARKKEHDQLLREYGFPSEQDPEANRYSRFAEVETDGKGKVLHNKPPWIVAENSEMVAEINDEDAPSYSKSPKAKNREGENTMSLTKRLLNVYKNHGDEEERERDAWFAAHPDEHSSDVSRPFSEGARDAEAYRQQGMENPMGLEDEENPDIGNMEKDGDNEDDKRAANRARIAAAEGQEGSPPGTMSDPVGTRGKRGRTRVRVQSKPEKMAKIDAMTKMILQKANGDISGYGGEPAGLSSNTAPARKKQTATTQNVSSASHAEPGSATGFMPKPTAAAPTGSGGKDPSKPNTGANFDASSVTMGPNASPESLAAARGLGIKTPSSNAKSAADSTGAGSIGSAKTTANQGTANQGKGDITEQMGLESQRGTGIQRRGRNKFDPQSVGEPDIMSSVKMEKAYNKLDKMYDDMITISKWVESKKA